ncbi:methyl-CpG-binding domain-containing protein 2-like isoform X2 [Silene latifolia]
MEQQQEELPEIETLENNDRQIVVYKPPNTCNDDATTNGMEIVPVPEPEPELVSDTEPVLVLPSVGAFTVQCAMCYKWRFIPTKEKYQEIREHVVEQPFTCDLAREWRPDITCHDPSDIEPDGSRLWAIDKPSIAQPPPGWDRELRIRGQGSYNFADVYYTSPTGKRLRSIVEVHKYLMKHPEFEREGVTLSQFSFKTPKPLQKNYTRKWSTPFKHSLCETAQDNPAALQLGESDSFKDVTIPRKKRSQPAAKNVQ